MPLYRVVCILCKYGLQILNKTYTIYINGKSSGIGTRGHAYASMYL